MTTQYHKSVERCLLALGEEWQRLRRVRRVCRGVGQPLPIVDARSKRVVRYEPDVYYVLRNNKKLIFEILDSEADKQDIVIADVIRSFLSENVDAVVFIHPGPEEVESRILEALITVYTGLVAKGVAQSDLPGMGKSGPYEITIEQAEDAPALREKLIEYSTENGWLRPSRVAGVTRARAHRSGTGGRRISHQPGPVQTTHPLHSAETRPAPSRHTTH